MKSTFIRISTIVCCWLVMSCAQDASKPAPAKPFDLKEPATAPTPPRDVSSKDQKRTFEPGELMWVKPDHKVVVHVLEEANATSEEHKSCCEDKMEWKSPGGYMARIIEGDTFHSMFFPTRDRLQYFATRYITDDTKTHLTDPNQITFQGVYFPSQMGIDDSPTLHLFQCKIGSEARYDVGDFHFPCWDTHVAVPEIKYGTQASRWLICERERLWNTYQFGYAEHAPGNRFRTKLPSWCEGTLEDPVQVLWEGVIIASNNISTATPTQIVRFQSFPSGIKALIDPVPQTTTPEGITRQGPEIPNNGITNLAFDFINTKEATKRADL